MPAVCVSGLAPFFFAPSGLPRPEVDRGPVHGPLLKAQLAQHSQHRIVITGFYGPVTSRVKTVFCWGEMAQTISATVIRGRLAEVSAR